MPGNEQYPGARRRHAKKGPAKGSGGKRRRGLEGRGPTPKAEDRVGHPRARAKARAEARAARNHPGCATARDTAPAEWKARWKAPEPTASGKITGRSRG